MEYRHQATFDQFSISIDHGIQYRNGEILKLRPKELALLWFLVQHAGNLVTKKQIIDQVWYGFPTSDESIARCISVIKARLKSVSPGAELSIKTEYGHGYRFVGEVTFPEISNKSQKKKKSIFGPTTLSEIASKDLLNSVRTVLCCRRRNF